MPWSSQGGGGGGWKPTGGGGGPWGSGPSGGGGNQQPDLEEILKKSQDRLKRAMPGGGMSRGFIFLLLLVGLLVIGFFGFTVRVNPDEQGVVVRFGEYQPKRALAPGLNFRLPYPIEQVYLPRVTRENSIEIGVRGADLTSRSSARPQDIPEESLMLTGDENIVDIDFVVFWRIKDAPAFLFNIDKPELTVKEVAESAMRDVVGKSRIAPLLAPERAAKELEVKELIQKTLDSYSSGVEITRVQLLAVKPPAPVNASFEDVVSAKQDRDKLEKQAEAYANRVIPEARGEAEKILAAAKAYKSQTVKEAQGEASRFLKVYEQYKKAPDITRKRLFLETMERVFKGTDKIILDNSKSGSGVVPYLPLNELSKGKRSGTER